MNLLQKIFRLRGVRKSGRCFGTRINHHWLPQAGIDPSLQNFCCRFCGATKVKAIK